MTAGDADRRPCIVAEISKNWRNGSPVNLDPQPIATLFEWVIEMNRQRGYRLHSFQLHQVMTAPDMLTETIVAVFEADPVSVFTGHEIMEVATALGEDARVDLVLADRIVNLLRGRAR